MATVVHIEDGDEIDLMERRLVALRLHTAGASYQTIADKLGVSRSTVQNDIKAQLKAELRESADDMIARQKAVVRDVLRVHYSRALSGDIPSTKAVMDALSHQAKLFGLWAPTRVNVVSDEDFSVTLARMMMDLGLNPPAELAAAVPTYAEVQVLEAETDDIETDDDWVT